MEMEGGDLSMKSGTRYMTVLRLEHFKTNKQTKLFGHPFVSFRFVSFIFVWLNIFFFLLPPLSLSVCLFFLKTFSSSSSFCLLSFSLLFSPFRLFFSDELHQILLLIFVYSSSFSLFANSSVSISFLLPLSVCLSVCLSSGVF